MDAEHSFRAFRNAWFTTSPRMLFAIIFIFVSACREDEGLEQNIVNEDNQYVNKWIFENMQGLYLWNDELPAEADTDRNAEPSEYFTSLLSDEDRFSWIQPDYQELLNSLQGINKEAGFEFVLYRESDSSPTVVAQILYVKPASPAENAGLKRGDIISKINGMPITTSNYRELIQDLKEDHTLVYKPIITGKEEFGDETTVQLSAVEYIENPNYLFKIITDGDRKIGYYVYNFFASGPEDDDEQYDLQMDDIFAMFKAEGITDLILDLRFNSGGSEVSAKNLASLVGTGIGSNKLFFSRLYNDELMEQIETDPELGDSFLKSYFLDKTANVGNQLSEGKVYILTSSRTASASELIINSLRPYMQVVLIGDVTYGKNVGSISIYEENDPKNTWGMQPIIVKVSNSVGFSDYGDGFIPDVLNEDNSLNLYPLGDPQENLLAAAIDYIKGVTDPRRVSGTSKSRDIIGHSLDEKRRGFSLIMEQKISEKNPVP
jgi:carboxyl-terminal processing protease